MEDSAVTAENDEQAEPSSDKDASEVDDKKRVPVPCKTKRCRCRRLVNYLHYYFNLTSYIECSGLSSYIKFYGRKSLSLLSFRSRQYLLCWIKNLSKPKQGQELKLMNVTNHPM